MKEIGKKKKQVDVTPTPEAASYAPPQSGRIWDVTFNDTLSYDELIKLSAESILEAMHIASASQSVDGMLNASVQWGELAAFVKENDTGRKHKFGFNHEEEAE